MLTLPTYIDPDFTKEPFASSPDAIFVRTDGAALPDGFFATTVFPEYVRIGGSWVLLENSRPDAAIALKEGKPVCVDWCELSEGDLIAVGRTDDGSRGLYTQGRAFRREERGEDETALYRAGYSRETSQTKDYDSLYEVLKYDREHGFILWALGAACAFDYDARRAMANIIKAGYADAVVAGNALAVYDLEASVMGTCCGRDVYTKRMQKDGLYNCLDTVNNIRRTGSVADYVIKNNLRDGIMAAAVREEIPTLLAGSARDDGPIPDVVTDSALVKAQLREIASKATTVVTLASQVNTVALSHLTPTYKAENGTVRPVYFFTVDISEFTVNKARDRGADNYSGIVTNIQDCLVNLERNLI